MAMSLSALWKLIRIWLVLKGMDLYFLVPGVTDVLLVFLPALCKCTNLVQPQLWPHFLKIHTSRLS